MGGRKEGWGGGLGGLFKIVFGFGGFISFVYLVGWLVLMGGWLAGIKKAVGGCSPV